METFPSLILASNSPRRKELIALGGWLFSIIVSNVDETLIAGEAPAEYVRRLAGEKARAVRQQAQDHHVIVGADTCVVIDGDVLGKPAGADEARSMLVRLRGRTHQVFTGICVYRVQDGKQWNDVVQTDVPMRFYSDEEITRYILSGDPMDKAGAYGIQNPDFQPVAQMEGCYASVMGLPVCRLSVLLRNAGIAPLADVAANCQAAIHYQCPVFPDFLNRIKHSLKISQFVSQC